MHSLLFWPWYLCCWSTKISCEIFTSYISPRLKTPSYISVLLFCTPITAQFVHQYTSLYALLYIGSEVLDVRIQWSLFKVILLRSLNPLLETVFSSRAFRAILVCHAPLVSTKPSSYLYSIAHQQHWPWIMLRYLPLTYPIPFTTCSSFSYSTTEPIPFDHSFTVLPSTTEPDSFDHSNPIYLKLCMTRLIYH